MILLFLKKYWFHVLAAAAIVYFGVVIYGKIYDSGYNAANNEWQQKWDAQAKELAEDRAKAEQQQREQEQEWQSKLNQVQANAQQQIESLETDLTDADSAAVSLREQSKRLAERASRSCQSPGTGSSGSTAETTGMVLADVLARVENAGRELAEAYDRARIAGLACEAAYDSIAKKSPD